MTLELQIVEDRPLFNGSRLRHCGGCTVCCTVMAVADLGKPYHCACQHLKPGGCGVYAQRPAGCSEYECLWTMGLGNETSRPDKSGVLWTLQLGDDHEGRTILTVDIHECRAGALAAVENGQDRLNQLDTVLPPEIRDKISLVRIFPFGVPLGNGFRAAPEYRDRDLQTGGMILKRCHPESHTYLYLGPSDDEGDLLHEGRKATERETAAIFQKLLKQIGAIP